MTIKEQIIQLVQERQRRVKQLYLEYQPKIEKLKSQCTHPQKEFNEWTDQFLCTECGKSWHYTEIDNGTAPVSEEV